MAQLEIYDAAAAGGCVNHPPNKRERVGGRDREGVKRNASRVAL